MLKAEEWLDTVNLGQKRLFQFWGGAFKFSLGKVSQFKIGVILNKCPDLDDLVFNFFFFFFSWHAKHPTIPTLFAPSLIHLLSPHF